jgi:hypothetical protein
MRDMRKRIRRADRVRRICVGGLLIPGMMIAAPAATWNQDASVMPGPAARVIRVDWNAASGRAVVMNGRLELVVETKSGLNARSLRDTKTGWVFADGAYSWPGGEFPKMEGEPIIADLADGGRSISLKGWLGSIAVEQVFSAPMSEPGVIFERIVIRNPGSGKISTAGFKCGFGKRIRRGDAWEPDAGDLFCSLPYRRETDGRMQEFPLREIVEHGMSYAGWDEKPVQTPIWGAEGWVWSRGTASLLVAKHNPESMEWSLMEPEKRFGDTIVRFGGAGQWKHGHPEAAAALAPGGSFRFGETRLQVIEGDWKQAYYAYRGYTERMGCRTPLDYDPPVHWNELYDNEYYPKAAKLMDDYLKPDGSGLKRGYYPINTELLKEFYTLDLMLGEAAKAKELGCEALYMDPGWDTGWNQQIWDASRLGPMDVFIKRLREEYGLKVSLWNTLGDVPPSYGDPEACPPESRVIDNRGERTDLFCFSSPAFQETKAKRLLELCRQGVAFLMIDSTQFSGPCYDKSHGHPIPSTREGHVAALLELIRKVKTRYPHVLIELHDPVSGPCSIHYTPTYFGFARPNAFDCLWGHEFMWRPLEDILTKRAVSLYYYNLAYSIPLYLHVNLKKDNPNSLIFWWFASTCRHLGVGGKPEAGVWEAEKEAMRTYRSLKNFYVQGIFYGIDEMVHAHTLPSLRESVINVFNIEDKPVSRTFQFRPAEIGLPSGPLVIEGASFERDGDALLVKLEVPAHGHRLLKVRTNAE